MRQIAVISGKGGTGKTVLTASFAALAKNACFVDCDVDAADLHLLLKPRIRERHQFISGQTAKIDKAVCTNCGQCMSICRFGAIREDYEVDPLSCEGCSICSLICPVDAIIMEENLTGEWYVSETRYGPFVHAKLGIAEENSGKLVSKIRQAAKHIAERENLNYIIIDGPPGIGCPVIASLSGVDFALIVTEPTLSGIYDMERVADVARHFDIPTKVVINKYDINLKNSASIEKICQKRTIEVLARLPFSEIVVRSMVNGMPLVEYCSDQIAKEIIALWNKI
ncbi:(4Fe-4S)-binding protein [candidate division WOR_3 bacterium SM23_60]|uniref:(4Fe-4S)-binding protein n=1 Tax=candidate division WOR_3 bacterium SM23_60 TaxID=1703780 RepID=A0A0S8GNN3_UNCW3|nr:MAG: (4Fe-4S)-binding protein [candidate division WOR_3 bacterium SM23_60]